MVYPIRLNTRAAAYALILALFISGNAALTSAQEKNATDWKKGKWGHLSEYIGTYDYEAVLNDTAVSAALSKALGEEKKPLIESLAVHNPIGFENDCLVMIGNPEKAGNYQKAYLNVCLYNGTINAALFYEGNITVYSDRKKYEYLPQSLRQWIYQAKNPAEFNDRPSYVQMIRLPAE